MTEMKRFTVAVPKEIEDALLELKHSNEYQRCSYSEIIRRLVNRGLELSEPDQRQQAGDEYAS